MADVRVRIVGKDESKGAISSARGGLSGLAGDAGKAESAFHGLNTKLLNLNAAIGVVSALKGALSGLANAIQKPLDAVASYERLSASIQALTARELRANDATLSMADAMKQAAVQSQETLNWIQKIAIESPFDRQGVADAYKTALAYGFTGKQAKSLTEELIDFAAATGQSSAILNQLAYPLGQIRAGTKVMTQDLRQLMTAGVPVQDILKDMGFSLEDVGKGLVKSDKFLEAFSKSLRRDFGGAAKAQAGTLAGLVSSLGDIEDIAMRNLFTPMFERAQPILNNIVEQLQMPGVARALGMVGSAIGSLIAGPLQTLGNVFRGAGRAFDVFDNAIKQGIKPIYAVRLALQTFMPPSLMPAINGIIRGIVAFTNAMEIANDPIAAFKKALEALQLPVGLEKIGKITIDIIGDVLQGDLVGAFGRVDDWLAAAKSFVDNVIDPALVGVLTGIWQGITPQIDVAVAEIVKAIDNAIGAKAAPDISDRIAQEMRDQAKFGVQAITKGDIAWATLGVRIGEKIEEWGDQLGPAVQRLAEKIWADLQSSIDNAIRQSPILTLDSAVIDRQLDQAYTQPLTAWLTQADKDLTTFFNTLAKQIFPDATGEGSRIGTDLGAGIKTGLEAQGAAIGEGGKAAVDTAMSAIRTAYGITSPSTWTRDNIGAPLAEGIAAGLSAGAAGIEAALRVAILGPMTRVAAEALQMARSIGSAMGMMGAPAGMGAPATVIVPTTIQALPRFGGISTAAMTTAQMLEQIKAAVLAWLPPSVVTVPTTVQAVPNAATVEVQTSIQAIPRFTGISPAAARPLDILDQMRSAVLRYLSGIPVSDIEARIYAAPTFKGISSLAERPLNIFSSIAAAVRSYLSGSPVVDVKASLYAIPEYKGISTAAPMPLDMISTITVAVSSWISAIPSLDVIVHTYALPTFKGISALAKMPLDLMQEMVNKVRQYIGIPAVDIQVSVRALPVFKGISESAPMPLDLIQQMTDAVRNYIGSTPVVTLPVRVEPLPANEPPAFGPLPSTSAPALFPRRAAGGPVSSFRPYVVGERGPEIFIPGRSGRIQGGIGETVVNLQLDGTTLARVVMDRMTGMVYEDSRRYG